MERVGTYFENKYIGLAIVAIASLATFGLLGTNSYSALTLTAAFMVVYWLIYGEAVGRQTSSKAKVSRTSPPPIPVGGFSCCCRPSEKPDDNCQYNPKYCRQGSKDIKRPLGFFLVHA